MGCCETKSIYLVDKNTINSIKKTSYKKMVIECIFDNFYDGDTADILFYDQNGNIIRERFRFWGFNAPEISQSRKLPKTVRANNKMAAIQARNELIGFLRNKKCVTKIIGRGKYGRLLGDVYAIPNQYYMRQSDLSSYMRPNYSVANHMINSKNAISLR